jgi:hypothetical protein
MEWGNTSCRGLAAAAAGRATAGTRKRPPLFLFGSSLRVHVQHSSRRDCQQAGQPSSTAAGSVPPPSLQQSSKSSMNALGSHRSQQQTRAGGSAGPLTRHAAKHQADPLDLIGISVWRGSPSYATHYNTARAKSPSTMQTGPAAHSYTHPPTPASQGPEHHPKASAAPRGPKARSRPPAPLAAWAARARGAAPAAARGRHPACAGVQLQGQPAH